MSYIMNKNVIAKNKTDGDPVPIYFKLQKKIQKEIENGLLKPDAAVPPERNLAEINKVSIGTVKKALLNLVSEGYLYRIQGKGTFVAGTTLRRENLRYYRFLKDFKGQEASIKIHLLDISKIGGIEPVNRYLKIRKDQDLYELKRTFTFGSKPVIYTISYMPQKMFPNLENFPRSWFERIPIFVSIEQSYGLPTIFNRELFSVTSAEHDVAKSLGLQENTPLLCIEMLAFTYKEKPYEYRLSYCLTDTKKVFREW